MTTTTQQPQVGSELRTQWKKWIMTQLGYPVVKVEVPEETLDICIDSAVRIFSQWSNKSDKILICPATAGQMSYNLLDIIPEYLMIRDVIYSPRLTDAFLTSFLGGIVSDFQFGDNQISYFHGTYSSMIDFTVWNLYREQYLRTIGQEGTWSIVGNTLHVAPAPDAGVKFGIIYSSMLIDEDIRRDEWVREWALTEVKMFLGRVRSKYGSIPGPRGDVTLDGETLISEAREDQATLRERLNEYIEPPQFEVG